jgi:hypothetical protein
MKLSTTAITLALALSTSSTFASGVVFKPVLENLETQVCLTAATKGLSASKDLIADNKLNYSTYTSTLTCNGSSLSDFAEKYAQQTSIKPEVTVSTMLVAKTLNSASKTCIDALVIGEEKAREKYGIIDEPISCNNQTISSFVSRYSKDNVIVKSFAE